MGKECQLAELPERLWHKIVGFLDSKELCHLSQVCRSLNGVAADDRVWQTLFTKYYHKDGEASVATTASSWKRLCRDMVMHKGARKASARPSHDSTSTGPHTPSSVSSESEPRDAKSPPPQEVPAASAAPPPVPSPSAATAAHHSSPTMPHEAPASAATAPPAPAPSSSDGAARSGLKPHSAPSTTFASSLSSSPSSVHQAPIVRKAIAPSAETQHISTANLSEQNEIVDIEGGDEPPVLHSKPAVPTLATPTPALVSAAPAPIAAPAPVAAPSVLKSSPPRARQPAASPPRTSTMDVSKLPLRKRFFKENAEFRASTDSVRSSAGMSDSSAAALASSATLLDQGASNQGKADVVMAEVDGGVTIAHDASASAPGPGAAFAALAAAAAADPAPHPRKARLQAFAGNPVKEEPAEALRSATPVNFATPSPAHAPHTAHQHQHQHHGHGHGHHAQEAVRHESASVKAETPKAASASAAVAPVAPASAAKPKPVLKRKASEDLLPVAAAPASAAVAAPPKAKEARAPKSSKKEAKKAAKVAGEPELYCFCRKPYDAAVFMIACDVCDEWYHGHCVGVREEEASNWKSYSCPDCRQESEDVEFEEDASGAIKSKKKKAGPVAKRCLNPTCAALAKSKSKYCSNACGVAVARENLRKKETGGKIEPSASAEQAPLAASAAASVAATPAAHIDDLAALDTPEDLADRKLLDELKAKRTAAERSLTHVERTLPELDRAIAVAGGAPHTAEPMSPGPVVRSDNDGELSARPAPADDMVDCVSCGNPLPVKALARHLDQCFHPRGKPDVATVLAQAGIVRDASANSPTPAKPAPRSPTKRDKDLLLCGFPTEEPGGARCERLRKACAAHTGWEAQRKTELVQERARLAQLLADIARQESAVIAQIKRRHPAAGGRTIQH